MLDALVADMHASARSSLPPGEHGDHDLTDRAQLRDHLAVPWALMRENRAVVVALFESAVAAGPASDAGLGRLLEDTKVLRDHLESLRAAGHALPGDPALVAAAMGRMLSYALPDGGPYSDDEVVDTLTNLLHGVSMAGSTAVRGTG